MIENAIYTDAAHTQISADFDGQNFSGITEPHRLWQEIIDAGITIAPYVPPPDKTDAEVDAEMDAVMERPEMKSILEALADMLPGPVSFNDVKAAAKAKGRVNLPR